MEEHGSTGLLVGPSGSYMVVLVLLLELPAVYQRLRRVLPFKGLLEDSGRDVELCFLGTLCLLLLVLEHELAHKQV